jgi:hypothetical protein
MPPKSAHLKKIDWKGALNQAVDEEYWPIGRSKHLYDLKIGVGSFGAKLIS